MNMRTRAIAGFGALLFGAGCATPRGIPVDAELKARAAGAQACYERGDLDRAATLYAQALSRARLVDAPDETARCAYNLALCRIGQGRGAEAARLLEQAGALASARGSLTVKVLLAQSESGRVSANPRAWREGAERALGLASDDAARLQARVLLAEAELAEGRFDAAAGHYRQATSLGRSAAGPALRARLEAVGARLAGERPDLVKEPAGLLLERRAEALREAGQFAAMAGALEAASGAHERAGNTARAFGCAVRGAQSFWAAGRKDDAARLALRARGLAAGGGRAEDRVLADSLVEEFKP
jgi:tetratricopeptide (TPR) repeat protein